MIKLIPFEKTQRSISLAMAEVIKKEQNGSRLAEYPYASAFFHQYFGKRNPNKSDLKFVCTNDHHNKKTIIANLDRFIKSNGNYRYYLDERFVLSAFPSLVHQNEVRFQSRSEMNYCRDTKIRNKQNHKHDLMVKDRIEKLMMLNHKELSQWVSNHEEELSELELRIGLNKWFDANVISDWKFNELYANSTAKEITYDLSFDDLTFTTRA